MELYAEVRRSVYVEGLSERAAACRFGLARETVRKMLRYRLPPGYRRAQPIRRPKLDAFTGIIDQILREDQHRPKKQVSFPSPSPSRQPTGGPPWVLIGGVVALAALAALALYPTSASETEATTSPIAAATTAAEPIPASTTPEVTPVSAPAAPQPASPKPPTRCTVTTTARHTQPRAAAGRGHHRSVRVRSSQPRRSRVRAVLLRLRDRRASGQRRLLRQVSQRGR